MPRLPTRIYVSVDSASARAIIRQTLPDYYVLERWLPAALALLAMAAVSLAIGLAFDAVYGFAFISIVALMLVAVELHYLRRLVDWIEEPDTVRLPDGWGGWQTVFSELYRAHRRQAMSQHKLEMTLERFRQAAGALPDGIIILNQNNYIEWCNSVAEGQLEIGAQRDRGLLLTNLVRAPQVVEYLNTQNFREPVTLRGPNGAVLSLQLVPFDQTSKLLISRDVTHFERVETVRRDFIANVSHELRTPLTVLNGFLETFVESEDFNVELARTYLPTMLEQARRMTRLVDDLLTLSRLESHYQVGREDSVNVRGLVSKLIADAKTLSGGRHDITFDCVSARLLGGEEELRSAFGNLINNAVRYTPGAGRIEISWKVENGLGVFRVQDNGVGIPPEHIPRLTERFYRVDRGRSRETGGTGLGLAIVKHVLNRHQASLDIKSTPGTGSSFCAVFPARRILEPQPATTSP